MLVCLHTRLVNFLLSKKRRILHTFRVTYAESQSASLDRAVLTRLSPPISLGTSLEGNYGNTPGFGMP